MENHNALKKGHEKAVGQSFIDKYNSRIGSSYRLVTSDERPDLIFEDPIRRRLGVEVTTIYYDNNDAKITWDIVRGNSSRGTYGLVNPDEALLTFTNEGIEKKCKDFATGIKHNMPCFLVCHGSPPLTDAADINRKVLPGIRIPQSVLFAEIWLALVLPDSGSPGGYRIWRVYP